VVRLNIRILNVCDGCSGGIRKGAIDARTYPPESKCSASEKLFSPAREFTFTRDAPSSECSVMDR
jgi:hypothetical protein